MAEPAVGDQLRERRDRSRRSCRRERCDRSRRAGRERRDPARMSSRGGELEIGEVAKGHRDIEGARRQRSVLDRGVDRCVAVWCGSTEVYRQAGPAHQTLAAFEEGLRTNDDNISPSAIYAYACLQAGVPYANGAPNLSVDIPAIQELATKQSALVTLQSAFDAMGLPYVKSFGNFVLVKVGDAAGVNLKLERRRAWLQAGAWAAALLITLGMGALWLLSWQGNRSLITDTEAQVTDVRKLLEKVSPDQREALAVLPLLDAVRTLPGGYAERDEGTPWRLGFGLYQGDMLGSEATAVYRRMLHGALLPRLILRLEQQIRANQANPDILFVALKTYLMLENPDHYEPDAIKAWIALDWDNNLPRDVTREQRQHLREHLDALFEKRPLPLPLALDRQLIGQTQAILVRVPLPVRAYDRMKRFVAQDNKAYPDFRIDTAAGRDAGLVLRRASGKPLGEGVPGFYTYRGYTEGFGKAGTELVARLAEESWVLGDVGRIAPQDLPQLIEDVRRLYFADYIKVWDALIADVGVVPLGNTQQAIDILRVLSGPGSPLKLWLEAVARETNLARKEGLAAAGDKAADSAVDKLKQQLASLIGSTGATPPPAVAAAQELDPVTRHFADLAAQVRKDGSNPAPIDATLAAFNDLYVKLNTQAGASGDALIKDAAGQTAAVVRGLKLDADRAPPAVGAVMKAVADQADGLTMGGVRNQINQLWQAEVADFYRQTLAGRYPLARSPRDAALADFGEFFAPDGRIDKFFKNYLARYVDQSTKPWRWQPNATDKLGISAGVLVQFQNAATIRDAYFRAGTAGPGVRFDLEG